MVTSRNHLTASEARSWEATKINCKNLAKGLYNSQYHRYNDNCKERMALKMTSQRRMYHGNE
nr:MAG TPA: hypothetical protein [Caudoviricetes sp.]